MGRRKGGRFGLSLLMDNSPSAMDRGETYPYFVCVADEDGAIAYEGDIDGFFSFVFNRSCSQFYAFKLSIVAPALVCWLESHGFSFSENALDKSYYTLISDQGNYYMMTIRLGGQNYSFYDVSKRAPNCSLADLSEKLELGIEVPSLEVEREPVVDDGAISHAEGSARIAIGTMKVLWERGMFSSHKTLTIAGEGRAQYKLRNPRKKYWRDVFPILESVQNTHIGYAYFGGLTGVRERYADRVVDGAVYVDVNSLYPYCMKFFPLPWGQGVRFEGAPEEDSDYPLWIAKVWVSLRLKKGYIPCAKEWDKNTLIIDTRGDVICQYVDSVQWELMQEAYEIDYVEWDGGYRYMARTDMFSEYVDYWGGVKAKSTGAERQIAKLLLDSLYGSWGMKGKRDRKRMSVEDGKPKVDSDGEYDVPGKYMPVAVFTTSYARTILCHACHLNFDRLMAWDTDCMWLEGKGDPIGIEIDDHRIGAWKRESIHRVRFIGNKTYAVEVEKGDGTISCEAKLAGVPKEFRQNITIDTIHRGLVIPTYVREPVKGGVMLQRTTMTLGNKDNLFNI